MGPCIFSDLEKNNYIKSITMKPEKLLPRLKALHAMTYYGSEMGIVNLKVTSKVRYRDIDALREMGILLKENRSRATTWKWAGKTPGIVLARKLCSYICKNPVYDLKVAARAAQENDLFIPEDGFRTKKPEASLSVKNPSVNVILGVDYQDGNVVVNLHGVTLPTMSVETAKYYGKLLLIL